MYIQENKKNINLPLWSLLSDNKSRTGKLVFVKITDTEVWGVTQSD